jgi:hypothetical protein
MAVEHPLWLVAPPVVAFALVTLVHHYPELPRPSLPRGRSTVGRPDAGGARAVDGAREAVTCDACGADNEAGYRYCAACARRL